MTNEEAARLLDPETNLAAMEELQYYHGFAWQEILVKALREARKMGADALRNTGCFRGEPLTLEQLREMDGQPVWVKVLDARFNEENQWAICNAEYQMVTLKDGFKLFFCGYESNWLAYAYHPTHIDQKAWEPCPDCKSCESCKNEADAPFGNGCILCKGNWKMVSKSFCSTCGRPLTAEAWVELEKRLKKCIPAMTADAATAIIYLLELDRKNERIIKAAENTIEAYKRSNAGFTQAKYRQEG